MYTSLILIWKLKPCYTTELTLTLALISPILGNLTAKIFNFNRLAHVQLCNTYTQLETSQEMDRALHWISCWNIREEGGGTHGQNISGLYGLLVITLYYKTSLIHWGVKIVLKLSKILSQSEHLMKIQSLRII